MIHHIIINGRLYLAADEIVNKMRNRFVINIKAKEDEQYLTMDAGDSNKLLIFDEHELADNFLDNFKKEHSNIENYDTEIIKYKEFDPANDVIVFNPNPMDCNELLTYMYLYINSNDEIIRSMIDDFAFSTSMTTLFNSILNKNDKNNAEIIVNLLYSSFRLLDDFCNPLAREYDRYERDTDN